MPFILSAFQLKLEETPQ